MTSEEFKNLKPGDRFFYQQSPSHSHPNPPSLNYEVVKLRVSFGEIYLDAQEVLPNGDLAQNKTTFGIDMAPHLYQRVEHWELHSDVSEYDESLMKRLKKE